MRKMKKLWKEFSEFAIKGNAMALAVGTIIGGAFGTITKSLTEDLIMPITDLCKDFDKVRAVVVGGQDRAASVRAGLSTLSPKMKLAAIHDGARPLVKPEHIEKVIKDASVFGGATLGVPVKDTIKVVNDSLITDTPYRPSLYITQTPQIFKKSVYMKAVQFAIDHELDFTDDCQLAEAIGCKVYMTTGDYTNIKITTPEDIEIAELLLRRQEKESAE